MDKYRRKHINNIARIVGASTKPEDKILDAGCGNKEISDNLLHGEIYTLDIWESLQPDFVVDISETPLPFDDCEYDVVLLIDVIEHLEKEAALSALKEFKRIANKIFILTPLIFVDNAELYSNSKSEHYKNPYNLHKSKWGLPDFEGWLNIGLDGLENTHYFGMWEKGVKWD